MRFSSDMVKKILACDQIDEGLEFDKRPGNQELILGHILLRYQEGKIVVPRDLTEIIGCSSESLRLMLRGAEKGRFLVCGRRPNYEILPTSKLLWLVHAVSNEWLIKNQRRLMPFQPSIREVYTVTQAFDIFSRINNVQGFMFKSPVKRGIVFFVLDKMRFGPLELKRLRQNFPIDHESLRQFVNVMEDAGYFEKTRMGNMTYVRGRAALKSVVNEAVNEVCAGLNQVDGSFSPYSDFLAWLKPNLGEKIEATALTH